jgi:hypothetical protein
VDVNKKKKADIADILTCQAPVSALTPVFHRTSSSVQAFKIADTFTTVSLTGYHKVVYLTEIDYWCTVGIIQVRNFVERGQIFFEPHPPSYKMTNRDNLNRLNVSILKSIATEHGVDVNKKKKADIADILTCQAPVSQIKNQDIYFISK